MARSPERERPPFFDNFDTRLAARPPLVGHRTGPPARRASRAGSATTCRSACADGRFDPLAIPPIADTMPPALIQKLGPSHAPFFAPSLDLTVHFLEDTTSQWLLTDVHARRARAGYATADVEIWDDGGTPARLRDADDDAAHASFRRRSRRRSEPRPRPRQPTRHADRSRHPPLRRHPCLQRRRSACRARSTTCSRYLAGQRVRRRGGGGRRRLDRRDRAPGARVAGGDDAAAPHRAPRRPQPRQGRDRAARHGARRAAQYRLFMDADNSTDARPHRALLAVLRAGLRRRDRLARRRAAPRSWCISRGTRSSAARSAT